MGHLGTEFMSVLELVFGYIFPHCNSDENIR